MPLGLSLKKLKTNKLGSRCSPRSPKGFQLLAPEPPTLTGDVLDYNTVPGAVTRWICQRISRFLLSEGRYMHLSRAITL